MNTKPTCSDCINRSDCPQEVNAINCEYFKLDLFDILKNRKIDGNDKSNKEAYEK